MGGKSSQSTQQITIPPEVMARYNAVNARAETTAQRPFQIYSTDPSAFVAPLSPTQQAGIAGTNYYANAAQPYYGAAVGQLGAGRAIAQPYYDAATGNVLNAQDIGTYYANQSYDALSGAQSASQPYYQGAMGAFQQGYAGAQPFNQYASQFGLAGAQAVNPSDLDQAAIQKYMSPYIQNVLEGTQGMLNQQNQQAMAGQLGNAIRQGAFGGDRGGIAAANLAQSQRLADAKAFSDILNQGYSQALGTAAGQQQLGYSAAAANRAAQQQAAQQMAALGQQIYGQGMGYGQAQQGLGAQQFAQRFSQAQQLAALGQQQFGQGLTAAQQQAALGAGLYGMDAQTAQALAALGVGAQGAGLQGAQAQLAAGQGQQATEQAGLQALYNQFLQQQSYPFQVAQFLANIAMGTGALSGTTTTTNQQLGGGFSDKRLKENIRQVGKTFDGQNIYSYNFKGSPKTEIGLLAQEVEKKHPEAVGLAAGYKTVRYDKATDDAADRGKFGLGGASMGGGVGPENFGEGYADGGFAGFDPGLYAQIAQMYENMYAPMGGGKGLAAGYVPEPIVSNAQLMTAPGIDQLTPDRTLEQMAASGQLSGGIGGLGGKLGLWDYTEEQKKKSAAEKAAREEARTQANAEQAYIDSQTALGDAAGRKMAGGGLAGRKGYQTNGGVFPDEIVVEGRREPEPPRPTPPIKQPDVPSAAPPQAQLAPIAKPIPVDQSAIAKDIQKLGLDIPQIANTVGLPEQPGLPELPQTLGSSILGGLASGIGGGIGGGIGRAIKRADGGKININPILQKLREEINPVSSWEDELEPNVFRDQMEQEEMPSVGLSPAAPPPAEASTKPQEGLMPSKAPQRPRGLLPAPAGLPEAPAPQFKGERIPYRGSGDAMAWQKAPVTSEYLAQREGYRHTGVDLGVPKNTPLGSFDEGVVVYAGPKGLNGNHVAVRHKDGTTAYYSHLNQINVEEGQKVGRGDVLGLSGNTGRSRGAAGGYHLHFEVRAPDGKPIHPYSYLENHPLSMRRGERALGGVAGRNGYQTAGAVEEVPVDIESFTPPRESRDARGRRVITPAVIPAGLAGGSEVVAAAPSAISYDTDTIGKGLGAADEIASMAREAPAPAARPLRRESPYAQFDDNLTDKPRESFGRRLFRDPETFIPILNAIGAIATTPSRGIGNVIGVGLGAYGQGLQAQREFQRQQAETGTRRLVGQTGLIDVLGPRSVSAYASALAANANNMTAVLNIRQLLSAEAMKQQILKNTNSDLYRNLIGLIKSADQLSANLLNNPPSTGAAGATGLTPPATSVPPASAGENYEVGNLVPEIDVTAPPAKQYQTQAKFDIAGINTRVPEAIAQAGIGGTSLTKEGITTTPGAPAVLAGRAAATTTGSGEAERSVAAVTQTAETGAKIAQYRQIYDQLSVLATLNPRMPSFDRAMTAISQLRGIPKEQLFPNGARTTYRDVLNAMNGMLTPDGGVIDTSRISDPSGAAVIANQYGVSLRRAQIDESALKTWEDPNSSLRKTYPNDFFKAREAVRRQYQKYISTGKK